LQSLRAVLALLVLLLLDDPDHDHDGENDGGTGSLTAVFASSGCLVCSLRG